MSYMDEYKFWLESDCFDEKTKEELRSIADDDKEIQDRFYKNLKFGTGGMRGIMGAGTNRMNIYTVTKATQGLADYILEVGADAAGRGVVIAHDCRNMSAEFTEASALCLNANGIKTYVFDALRPTPELSFAVRELGCIAGIVVTASHNPPEYNGYKVYWEDGSQIVSPQDQDILKHVADVERYEDVKTMDKDKAVADGLFCMVPASVDENYYQALIKQTIHGDIIPKVADDIKIVYTPLHGTGNVPVREVLKRLGFKHVYVVEEQTVPDGDFSTVKSPNPEEPSAFAMGIELAKKVDADVIMATDPDADRLGVYSKDTKTGEYQSFTGNMSAMLIAEYILSQRQEKGLLHKNGAFVKTIVSTNMADSIAKEYNLKLIEVLTGFKFIGEQIKFFEQQGTYEYEFGFEESYGCLVGTHARDKDAIVAVMALCEAAAYYKNNGLTLWDQMINIYEKYGYYKEGQVAITMKGAEGAGKIAKMMDDLRNNTPSKIGNWTVLEARDYKKDECVNMVTGDKHSTGLPNSNVLYYDLSDNAWCCARPSGTEPKIKFYMGVKGSSIEDAAAKEEALKKAVMELVGQ